MSEVGLFNRCFFSYTPVVLLPVALVRISFIFYRQAVEFEFEFVDCKKWTLRLQVQILLQKQDELP